MAPLAAIAVAWRGVGTGRLGRAVGFGDGIGVGRALGRAVGAGVGDAVGRAVGAGVGTAVGFGVGAGALHGPVGAMMTIFSPLSAQISRRRGPRFTLLIGYVFCLLGFLTIPAFMRVWTL